MSLVRILDIDVHFLKAAAGREFMDELGRNIEARLDGCGEPEGGAYGKPEMAQMIHAVETAKYRFLQGQITAKQLYRDVVANLDRFKAQHPAFDYLRDPVLERYYSSQA